MSDMALPVNPFPGFYAMVRVGIFWDMDQRKIDDQNDAHSAPQNIRKTLSVAGHFGDVEIMAYGIDDGHDFKDQAKFSPFPAGADIARHTKMLEDIRVWSSKSGNPSNLFLIMGEPSVDFRTDIEILKSSKHYKIHYVEP
ncbi:hypothetical protein Bca52824_000644 [Brassica carinata]|uniref:NYN domain-containing protein n=1 Tax=Brassica carinata TaxID=52824 RepID=A0A8X7WGT0_BRACI|nr:hypothetical protein Bca52824_000644 [Brassica carinata]